MFIVLGAGLAGSAAAWQLTRRGHPVTVLERSRPANPQGSSHGSARIFRYAYPEQLYADLVVRARGGWDELEAASGQALISPTGCLDFGATRGPEQLASVLTAAGVEHEVLSVTEASARWPQIAFDTPVLYQPGAGVLNPDASIAAMLALAEASGHAELRTGWEASALERTATGWRVHARDGDSVEGAGVILAVGGWLPDLLAGAGLPTALSDAMPPLHVSQEQAFHFPYPATAPAGDGAGWPAFIHKSHELSTYGLPGGADAGFAGQKVARYNGGTPIGSASRQTGQVDPADRAWVTDYVARWLPGLVPEPYAETTCLFTNTPTEDFVIDASDGVVLVSACSGHGAKFTPLLGELAADLALGTGSVPPSFRVDHRAMPAQR